MNRFFSLHLAVFCQPLFNYCDTVALCRFTDTERASLKLLRSPAFSIQDLSRDEEAKTETCRHLPYCGGLKWIFHPKSRLLRATGRATLGRSLKIHDYQTTIPKWNDWQRCRTGPVVFCSPPQGRWKRRGHRASIGRNGGPAGRPNERKTSPLQIRLFYMLLSEGHQEKRTFCVSSLSAR